MEYLKKSTRSASLVKVLFLAALVTLLLILVLDAKPQSIDPVVPASPGSASTSMSAARKKVREIYTSQLGVRETTPNAGQHVEKYLRYVGLPPGNPWCAAFVCWVYGQAGIGNPRTGWSPDLFRKERVVWERLGNEPGTKSQESGPRNVSSGNNRWKEDRSRELTAHSQPQPADVFGLYFPEKGRIAHVGFIDEWKEPWLITVEGNTNILGSREGDGVYRKRRLTRSVYKVARYVN